MLPPPLQNTWRNVGTYRLQIQLPDAASGETHADLALRIANVHTAYRLFVNGELRQTVGRPGMTAETTVPQFRPIVVPLDQSVYSNRTIELLFQVSGFHHRNGGLWKPPELGYASVFAHEFVAAEWIQFGLYIGMAVFFLVLFAGSRRSTELLIFAGLNGLIALRSILTQNRALVQLWPDLDFGWNYRLEYLSFVLIPPAFAALFYTMFPGDRLKLQSRIGKWAITVCIVVGLCLGAIILATPARIYTGIFTVALAQVLLAACLTIYLLIYAIRRGETEAKLLLIGTVIVVGATINDDLHNRNVIQSVYLATASFAFFLLFMAGLLGLRIRRAEKQREIAEARFRARNEFFSMMSHELRTPLHALLGMVQLMETTDLPDPRQHEYMRIMRRGGESLLALVNDILDLARVEAGKMDFLHDAVELRPLINETAEMFRGQAAQKEIPILIHIDDRMPEFFSGDTFRIRQVLMNLLGNALKFTTHGQIEITCALASGEADRIEFAVTDTGPGIPPEKQISVFESFHQGAARVC